MLPLETLGAFFVTAIVMGLAPGPDNIFVGAVLAKKKELG